jgi:hypothetical protein
MKTYYDDLMEYKMEVWKDDIKNRNVCRVIILDENGGEHFADVITSKTKSFEGLMADAASIARDFRIGMKWHGQL